MLERFESFGPLVIMVTAVGVMLWVAHWLLIKRHPDLGNERLFPRQLIMLGLTLLGLLAVVLVLPVSDTSRNQLMGLIGILISETENGNAEPDVASDK
jgi:ABC-type iron transport system FetAB permease component